MLVLTLTSLLALAATDEDLNVRARLVDPDALPYSPKIDAAKLRLAHVKGSGRKMGFAASTAQRQFVHAASEPKVSKP